MRLRREPEPSPETTQTLAAVDAALAGDPVAPEHEDVGRLALALRDERPVPRPEVELALDLRVHEGFPRDDGTGIQNAPPARRRELHAPHRLRTTPLALGTAAALFIVVTAVFTTDLLGGSQDERPTPDRSDRGQVAAPPAQDRAAGATEAAEPSVTGSPSPVPLAQSVAPRAQRREVERAAELALSAPRNDIEDIADGVIRVTDRQGGFVLSSSVSSGTDAKAGASFDLRIPSERLPQALADLSELAHVQSRTQAARDITAEFTSPRRRLADALAERRALLRQLARADTPNETAAIRARLRAVNRRIDRSQAQLRRLRERVGFAAVSVSVEPGAARDDGGWSLGDATRDALGVLGAVAGAAIVGLAVAIPAAVLGFVAWFAYKVAIRRRRERALDLGEPAPKAPQV